MIPFRTREMEELQPVVTSTDKLVTLNEALQREITERRRVEARLESVARIPEESPDPVLRASGDGRVLYANAAARVVLDHWHLAGAGDGPIPSPWSGLFREMLDEGRPRSEVEMECGGRSFSLILRPVPEKKYVNIYGVDITERKQAEESVRAMANRDELTGLANRVVFADRLANMVSQAKRNKHKIAVHVIDLDNFKEVNESLGHEYGDKLLQHVAKRIAETVRESDTVARLSSDEFAVLQYDPKDSDGIAVLAQKLLDAINGEVDLDGHRVFAQASVGITIFPDDAESPDDIMRNADMALHFGRAESRGTYNFFVHSMNEEIQRRRALEGDMRRAIQDEAFEVYYQPKLHMHERRIAGMEALLRWNHPELGMIPPSHFIPIAERTKLILPIGEWVLYQACEHAKALREQTGAPIKVAVNLSAMQLHEADVPALIRRVLDTTHSQPEFLEIEITESVAMTDAEKTIGVFRRIADLGVSLSIDDFGTGYSSLSYLKNFPVQRIKIDKAFVDDIDADHGSGAIARAVANLGHSFGMEITAEGVETLEQLRYLQTLDCDEIQGWYFAKPMPKGDLVPFVSAFDAAASPAFQIERRAAEGDRRQLAH